MSANESGDNAVVAFGGLLKRSRKKSGKTARAAAIEAGMQPSNYCRLEYGTLRPPQTKPKLDRLADAVGIPPEGRAEFYDLAAAATQSMPLDLAEIISTDDAIPLMLRTLGKKRLTKQQVAEIIKLVRGKSD